MNKIENLFITKKKEILSIYFTAGYPNLDDTNHIIESLSATGADMIEIGIPFSDPMADGPVIQQSSEQALKNGMSLPLLFKQLRELNNVKNTPLILMGYLNPVMHYGMTKFLDDCIATGIDGVIIPDLPPEVFNEQYKLLFNEKGVEMIFLITPQTPVSRIREIDALSNAFIYMVTVPGTTGKKSVFSEQDHQYFKSVKELGLKNPLLAGFGIHNNTGFIDVCKYVEGAIIGSSFINALPNQQEKMNLSICEFIKTIRK